MTPTRTRSFTTFDDCWNIETRRESPVRTDMLDPGATVSLSPGGYHLMLFEPVEPLRNGMRLTLILELEKNGNFPVELEVRR